MNSNVTILLDLSDVQLVEPPEIRRYRWGRLRVFLLSVLLGLTIGMAFSLMDPVRSKRASVALRGRLATARVTVASFVAQRSAGWYSRLHSIR